MSDERAGRYDPLGEADRLEAGEPGTDPIGERLGELASVIGDVEIHHTETGTEYRTAGRTFAVRDGQVLGFLLGAPIVAAALKTPDTGPSDRGPEWIDFTPVDLDRFTLDRLGAWFEAAHRRAGG